MIQTNDTGVAGVAPHYTLNKTDEAEIYLRQL